MLSPQRFSLLFIHMGKHHVDEPFLSLLFLVPGVCPRVFHVFPHLLRERYSTKCVATMDISMLRWRSRCTRITPKAGRDKASSRMTARIHLHRGSRCSFPSPGKLLSERDVTEVLLNYPPHLHPPVVDAPVLSTGRQVPNVSRGEPRFHHELHHLLNLHCRPDDHRHGFELTACQVMFSGRSFCCLALHPTMP